MHAAYFRVLLSGSYRACTAVPLCPAQLLLLLCLRMRGIPEGAPGSYSACTAVPLRPAQQLVLLLCLRMRVVKSDGDRAWALEVFKQTSPKEEDKNHFMRGLNNQQSTVVESKTAGRTLTQP